MKLLERYALVKSSTKLIIRMVSDPRSPMHELFFAMAGLDLLISRSAVRSITESQHNLMFSEVTWTFFLSNNNFQIVHEKLRNGLSMNYF